MNIKFAELKVNKSTDYKNEVVKTLEDAGFILTLELDTYSDAYYIVAKAEEQKDRK